MKQLSIAFAVVLLLACGGAESEQRMGITRHVLWHTLPTQSNGWGVNPGGPGNQSLAAVPYYDSLLGTSLSTDLHPLNDTHGKDWEIGAGLYAAGYNPIIVNVSRGSTYANMWIPGGTYYAPAIAEIANAWALVQAAFPQDNFTHHHLTDQGEEDIRYPTQGIPSLWAANVTQSHAGLVATVGSPMDTWVFKTHSTIDNATFPELVNGLQRDIAGGNSRFIDRDAFEWEPNGVHSTTSGYIATGRQFVAQFEAMYPTGIPRNLQSSSRRNYSQVRCR